MRYNGTRLSLPAAPTEVIPFCNNKLRKPDKMCFAVGKDSLEHLTIIPYSEAFRIVKASLAYDFFKFK